MKMAFDIWFAAMNQFYILWFEPRDAGLLTVKVLRMAHATKTNEYDHIMIQQCDHYTSQLNSILD